MILTRLTLNPRHPEAARDLAVPYEMHRTLARCFPELPSPPVAKSKKEEPGYRSVYEVLFRIEPMRLGMPQVVLVQSAVALHTAALPEGYAVRVEDKAYAPDVVVGQSLGFRLLANPVFRERRKEGESGKHSRRRPLPLMGETYGASPALAWMERQGIRYGFALERVAMQAVEPPSRERAHGKGATAHQGVLFEGRLSVVDAEAFGGALRSGIGPAKAFGFGLLSIAP